MPHQAIPSPLGEPFIELTTVDSTNNYAMAQVQKGAASHGTAYFAYEQTAGKGQRGKSWTTNPGKNLILSVILTPGDRKLEDSFLLSATIANACYDFFKNYAGPDTKIKWPNDIYWRDRKTGGILIENVLRSDRWLHSIVGIGLNINQTSFDESLVNPVSLKQITGNDYNPVLLAKELCVFLTNHYRRFQVEKGTILDDYNRNLYKLNSSVMVRTGNMTFQTTIKEVLPSGHLVTYDTTERKFDFGEIEWIL
ncbi:MAG TPA: biotin--[acetyl-CoA-carboxylase] ligase [Flavitalea sp.]|nr:biotin--[acetyl-CoA-carboxylase] ligase [Flavitalea sp.]